MRPGQIQDALNIGFFTLNPDYTVSSWNRWLELKVGIKQADILNNSIFHYFSNLDNPAFRGRVESVLKSGNHVHFSHKHHKYLLRVEAGVSGKGIFDNMQQNCTMGPVKDEAGTIAEVFFTITDVTDMAVMEVEFRKSMTMLNSIIDDQTELICRFSPDGIITFANDSFCRYLSRSRDDILGTSAFVFIYKGDWRKMIGLLKSLSPSNPLVNVEFRVVMPDTGDIRWQNWTGKAFFNANGEITEFQTVGRDITRQKEADEEIRKSRHDLEQKVRERTKALRESEGMYRSLFEGSRDGLVIVGEDDCINEANPKFMELTGYHMEELRKMQYGKLLAPSTTHPIDRENSDMLAEKGYSGIYEAEYRKKDSTLFPVSIRSYTMLTDREVVMHNVRDITERRASEAERVRILKDMEYKVKHFRCLYIVTASIKMSENLQEMCREIIQILKSSMQYPEMLCVKICINGIDHKSPDYRNTPWSLKSEMLIKGASKPSFLELNYLQEPPVVERPVLQDNIIALDPYPFTRGEAELVDMVAFLIGEDIEHRSATDELDAYHERLKALSHELENVGDNERTKIAGELHDQIGQKLAFLKMHVGRLKEGVSEEARPTLESTASLLNDIIRDSRTIMLEISPAALFELGFSESISWLADKFKDSHGLNVAVVSSLKNGDIPQEWFMPLFKVVRESLNNVVKHAGASEVTVYLGLDDDNVRLMVQDNGNGFDPGERTSFGRRTFSLGLFNIRQTLGYLGGALDIESHPGEGTTVIASLPCNKEDKVEY